MKQTLLESVGIVGSVIGMILMPCCFPIVLSLLGAVGLHSISLGPWTPYFIIGSSLVLLLTWIWRASQTHIYRPILGGIACISVLSYYLFVGGSVWLHYLSLAGLFGISMRNIFIVPRVVSLQCGSCTM